jgi:hypothetical protein
MQGRIMTSQGPRLMKLYDLPQMEPPSNSPTPILNNFYSWYIYIAWSKLIANSLNKLEYLSFEGPQAESYRINRPWLYGDIKS